MERKKKPNEAQNDTHSNKHTITKRIGTGSPEKYGASCYAKHDLLDLLLVNNYVTSTKVAGRFVFWINQFRIRIMCPNFNNESILQ
jgi:hypothetical protein